MNAERKKPNGKTGQPGGPADPATRPAVRCAIYTRKSTDENLDSDFNSLDAQREAAENYIKSQLHEGWMALPDRYDDGAYSGATIERPALQRLMADIGAGRVDAVICYKIDRFSRSLLDFTKLIEVLEAHNVSLVAVTQQFNTTTSMGRLTLNILLSFAQFEREVITERIRDKIAACKKRGMYLGGIPPLGYDVDRERKRLIVNAKEAILVRTIFRRYLQLGSTVALIRELNKQGHTTKAWTTKKGIKRPGQPWNTGAIYKLLDNPIFIGRVRHHDQTYQGEHEAIIERSLWDEVQAALAGNHRDRSNHARATTPSLLRGILCCGHCDAGMTTTFTRKKEKVYRYYLCGHAAKHGRDTCPLCVVPAGDIETAVLDQVRQAVRAPEVRTQALAIIRGHEEEDRKRLAAEKEGLEAELATLTATASRMLHGPQAKASADFVVSELARIDGQVGQVRERLAAVNTEIEGLEARPTTDASLAAELATFDRIWAELVPAEQERLVHLVVERVTVHQDGLDLALRADGVAGVVRELRGGRGDGGRNADAAGAGMEVARV